MTSCDHHDHDVTQIDFYKMDVVDANELVSHLENGVLAMKKSSLQASSDAEEFVRKLFFDEAVSDMLIYLSRLPVFGKKFAEALKHNLDLLATAKKLKYFTNLSLGQNAILLKNFATEMSRPIEGFQKQIDRLFENRELASLSCKDFMKTQNMEHAKKFLENDKALESIDPHSVYPTSIYRHCDGCVLATKNSQTIEAVMGTNITTTIKITRNILDPKNLILAEVYKPLGRCVAIVDDKVDGHYSEDMVDYFSAHDIKLVKLVHNGNEINKGIQNVNQILVDMKNHGVARNEPVLIVGGGVISDIGGLATALYHRNTPYVMLCTSIVSGIDAGPSPRTCCDGHGFKNLFGAYHPPVLTLTDRYFWRTLRTGWIRHGIAEIIKMACVKDFSLFELLEKAGPRLITTKFGTEGCEGDSEFQDICDEIVGKAMESYVRSEYGNLWETHQCRPHAFGHTWSPGYELPAGMLHGHAVATCMGYGAFLSFRKNWISKKQFDRILKLISDMELALWHPIMDNHDLVISANKKVTQKRGGNLCAPVPKGKIGLCGYINELKNEHIPNIMNEYKAIVSGMPRNGLGIDMHCHDVGLEDPSTVAQDALIQIGQAPKPHPSEKAEQPEVYDTYMEWIEAAQKKRNTGWAKNVQCEVADDTDKPIKFDNFSLFHEGAEAYAMANTTLASKNVQNASVITEKQDMFMPCMVGSLESQFLKMQCMISGAKRCLDIGTFTGMSALAMAEGIPDGGEVVTMECYDKVAKVAQRVFDESSVTEKIDLRVCNAVQEMQRMVDDPNHKKFDLIFIDADKETYVEYYELSMKLLQKGGIILADNSLCALLYDQKSDKRSQKLHEFNQHVKNDSRTEQVVLTIREGITLIKPIGHDLLPQMCASTVWSDSANSGSVTGSPTYNL